MKIWASLHSKRTIISKRSLSAKKVLYAIFFSGEGVAIKVLVEKGKSITIKYYKDARPVTGFKHIRLLPDNVHTHTSLSVTSSRGTKVEKMLTLAPERYTVSHFSYAPFIKCKITQKRNVIFLF